MNYFRVKDIRKLIKGADDEDIVKFYEREVSTFETHPVYYRGLDVHRIRIREPYYGELNCKDCKHMKFVDEIGENYCPLKNEIVKSNNHACRELQSEVKFAKSNPNYKGTINRK